MRIHLLEHEIEGISRNILNWAYKTGCALDRTFICNSGSLPVISDFDLLITAGGPQHIWEEDKYPWLLEEIKLITNAIAAQSSKW